MAEETEIKTGEGRARGVIESSAPDRDKGILENVPSVLNSKEDLEKLTPELRAIIEKLIPSKEELEEERKRWERESDREKLSGWFNDEASGEAAENKVKLGFKKLAKKWIKKALIWLKFRFKIGVKFSKTITHDEWMSVRAEPGYFIYNYEYGFLKSPKVIISSPTKETDYLLDEKTGHILIRRGLPIGIGSPFKVRVDIK